MTRFVPSTAAAVPVRLCLLLAGLSVLAATAVGQEGGEGAASRAGAAAPTKVIPTISTAVYERLEEAQVCLDEGDIECANRVLERLSNNDNLNNYEIAQIWNFRAFVYFEQDNVEGAIDAYERILEIPHADMPDGMIGQTTRNLATLYIQAEDYPRGLATFEDYMALPFVEPNEDDYVLLAQIHYSMENYAEGIPPIQQAIRMANDKGEIGEEGWYQLLYVFYFNLEQTDRVIETLEFMVENWTKREWMLALAGQLSGQDRRTETLTLYEAAYDAGFLTRGTEWVQLANLHLDAGAPYKAAVLLEQGLNDGTIESTEPNWRLLAQSWQMAKEDERALPAFRRAAMLADDGNTDRMLAQSLARLARWEECAEATRAALDKGGLDRTDYIYMQLGQCLFNLKRFDEARTAFQAAARDERRSADARNWIRFVDDQVERERLNAEALENLARN